MLIVMYLAAAFALLPPPRFPFLRLVSLKMMMYHPAHGLIGYLLFENPAKIMACGTLRPVVMSRIRTASSTFFICAALFFGMLGKGLYSVETDLRNE